MNYSHLSQGERYQIQALLGAGISQRGIARRLMRSASSISREIRRNQHSADDRYEGSNAHRRSAYRRSKATVPRIAPEVWNTVEQRLREKWSPAQITGRAVARVSHERIYQHIAQDRKQGGTLWTCRRRPRAQRKNRCGKPRDRQRFGGQRISERPVIVASRRRVGDWEGDSIVGPGNARIITLVERKTGYVRLHAVADGTAHTALHAIVQALHPLRARVHTLTWDNGSEFAEHAIADQILKATSYFADPYCAWQRGCNENLNGLLRQYFPKGCDLAKISEQELARVEQELNQRPRKRLGFKTPEELFLRSLKRVALRT
ncbi:MAG: IS30 family transposase [Dokdonella sp.]